MEPLIYMYFCDVSLIELVTSMPVEQFRLYIL